MDLKGQYSTSELEKYINTAYASLKVLAERDGIYKPLDIYFSTGTPQNIEGGYCYSDESGYHYCYTERGNENMHKTTWDLSELAYWIIKDQVFWMAFSYEQKHRIKGQDSRRLAFGKELQLLDAVGENYKKRDEAEINAILKESPYQDHLF